MTHDPRYYRHALTQLQCLIEDIGDIETLGHLISAQRRLMTLRPIPFPDGDDETYTFFAKRPCRTNPPDAIGIALNRLVSQLRQATLDEVVAHANQY
jgi:hypothetical protein